MGTVMQPRDFRRAGSRTMLGPHPLRMRGKSRRGCPSRSSGRFGLADALIQDCQALCPYQQRMRHWNVQIVQPVLITVSTALEDGRGALLVGYQHQFLQDFTL